VNPLGVDAAIFQYATGWHDAIASRIVIAGLGLVILGIVIRAAAHRDCTLLAGLLWILLGVVFMVFAAIPEAMIKLVVSTEYLTRIRVIMGALSVLVLLIAFEAIRRNHLQERYALLWVATAVIVFLTVLFPRFVDLFRAVTGMQYVTAVVALAFTFLMLLAFHFSISMSQAQNKQSKMAQRIAILESRIRDLERKQDNPESPPETR